MYYPANPYGIVRRCSLAAIVMVSFPCAVRRRRTGPSTTRQNHKKIRIGLPVRRPPKTYLPKTEKNTWLVFLRRIRQGYAELLKAMEEGPYPVQLPPRVFLGRIGMNPAYGTFEKAARRWNRIRRRKIRF